jgi:hypothetical protein
MTISTLGKKGAWIVLEDDQDICSIGLDKKEIDIVIEKLKLLRDLPASNPKNGL